MFCGCLSVLSKGVSKKKKKKDKNENLIMWFNSNKDWSTCIPELRYSKKYHRGDAKGQAKAELQVLWRVRDINQGIISK